MRALLLTALMAAAASAQTIEVSSLFHPAPLAGVWKHQAGDDPHWADPAFDDSAWPDIRMPEGAELPASGFSWYRFRVRLPETIPPEPLALMIDGFGNCQAYEVFWNGQRVGVVGEPDRGLWGLLLRRPRAFPVPGSAREAVIAIRLRGATVPFVFALPGHRTSWIGARERMEGLEQAWRDERLRSALPTLLLAGSLTLPAVFFLLLPSWRGGALEYFWFGLWLLAGNAVRVLNAYPETFLLETGMAISWVSAAAASIQVAGWVGLLHGLFRGRIPARVWLAAAVGPVLVSGIAVRVMLGGSVDLRASALTAFVTMILLSYAYYELGWRTPLARERVPAIHGAILAYLAGNMAVFLAGFASFDISGSILQGLLIRSALAALFAFAMAILMNQRSALLLSERQRLGREMESAAEVQSLLLTSPPAAGDAYRIEPVYQPASEVGGDFYRIFPAGDGAILVVVGDVSGKGLRAAMTVSGLLGAMEAIHARRPGAFLEELNRAASAHIHSGFATCCAALIQRDGEAVIANAGHPPPYCDGREVEAPGGLPLGIAPGVEYAESAVRGDQFTFVSDGVVEAENPQRELFGFERTRAISAKSAREIADAAKAWGQNDDITVVTVRRNA